MPTYVLLSSLTPEGRKTLHANPERLEQVNKEIGEFGCTVLSQYRSAVTLSNPRSTRFIALPLST